uniref:Protein HIRA n=1 Tax=Dracunculus medinensis TaxID=318479 RepID=A0A158Q446_DRAME
LKISMKKLDAFPDAKLLRQNSGRLQVNNRFILTDPVWVHHEGGPIYSLDMHPSGKKLATCGQILEAGKGIIVIWNVEPVLNEVMAKDTKCVKCLAVIPQQRCINCVRWSTKGEWLACAGDERLLAIYEYGGRINSAGSIGSKAVVNFERYREKFRLYGHDLDVFHLEWSKDGRFLASCGMCARVIIWDAQRLPKKIMTLDASRGGHTQNVKGLSWDPIGKFLATQSSDKSIKIWATDSWQCVKTISEPFVESCNSTMFCRLDWSPDGAYLIAPCATNNAGPTAQLIRRKDWDMSLDLVGHRKAVTVVRACPRMIEYTDHKGKLLHVCCFAMGSRDKTLSVWLIPNVSRPLVVLQRLFKHSILDLNDFHLTISSMDGSIKSILLNAREVGRLLSSKEMGDMCERLYSRRPLQYCDSSLNCSSTVTNGSKFVDDLANLNREKMVTVSDKFEKVLSEEQKKSDAISQKNNEDGKQKQDVEQTKNISASSVPVVQAESRTKSNKRRIQPLFVASLSLQENEPPSKKAKEQSREMAVTTFSPKNQLRKKDSYDPFINQAKDEAVQVEVSTFKEAIPAMVDKPILRMAPLPDTVKVCDGQNQFIKLPIPPHKPQHTVVLETNLTHPVDKIDVFNDVEISLSIFATKLTGSVQNVIHWNCYINSSVCSLAANNYWTVVGCYDRCMFIYCSQSGLLYMNLMVDSIPSYLYVADSFLSVCSSYAFVYVWDLGKKKSILSRRSLNDLFEKDADIVLNLLGDSGSPIIGLSSGKTFLYSLRMDCWFTVAEYIHYSAPIGIMGEIRGSVMQTVLEERLNSAFSLHLPREFRHTINIYIRNLVQTVKKNPSSHFIASKRISGNAIKLKDIFTLLSREKVICGLKSDVLIRELLPTLQANPCCAAISEELKTREENDSVKTTLLLFGSARELAKFSEKEILVPATTNKCELMQFIFDEVKEISCLKDCCLLALNQEYVCNDETIQIQPHSEIAIIPPLSGG